MAVPDFPTDHPPAPAQPRSRSTALTLALLFGPFGLMYTSIGAGLFMLFVLITLGLFTVGMGVIPVWLLCVAWAWLANHETEDAKKAGHGG
jgi:hypothetical protein